MVLKKLALKLLEKKVLTFLYTLAEKKYVALIYTFVASLREVQIKAMGDTVTTIETKVLVKTLRHALIRMKSRCRTTR